jgi:hypothetical protein
MFSAQTAGPESIFSKIKNGGGKNSRTFSEAKSLHTYVPALSSSNFIRRCATLNSCESN